MGMGIDMGNVEGYNPLSSEPLAIPPESNGAFGNGGPVNGSSAHSSSFVTARERERASVSSGNSGFNLAALDLSDMREFLTTPCPKGAGIVQCYIRYVYIIHCTTIGYSIHCATTVYLYDISVFTVYV
jgi:hypothetical protein